MAPDIVDIDEVIKKWARSFPFEKEQKRLMAEDILSSDINFKHLKVFHDKPKYDDKSKSAKPLTHVLFTAKFTNSTDQSQVYSFKTERKTRSTCTLNVSRGYRFDAHMDIKLTPPNPIIQANAGFRSELCLSQANGQTFEEEITWSVDSNVNVPPKYVTMAELVMKEDEYSGHFLVRSRFEGRIHITLRNKKDNSVVTTITGDVKQIFTPEEGFQVDKSGVYCVTQGVCQCRYGIEQHVRLSQRELEKDKDGNEIENEET